MPLSMDMSLEDLKKYKPALTRRGDFEDFGKTHLRNKRNFLWLWKP